MHGDIKPENVLLDSRGNPRVSDFGLSKSVGTVRSLVIHGAGSGGTPGFMAPEVSRSGTSKPSDVFSFGMMLPSVLTGKNSFAHLKNNAVAINVAVCAGERPDVAALLLAHPDAATDRVVALAKRLWAAEPSRRPTMARVAVELEEAVSGWGGGAAAEEDELFAFLKAHKLEMFHGALADDGYTRGEELSELSADELRSRGTAVGMKPGHLARFVKLSAGVQTPLAVSRLPLACCHNSYPTKQHLVFIRVSQSAAVHITSAPNQVE